MKGFVKTVARKQIPARIMFAQLARTVLLMRMHAGIRCVMSRHALMDVAWSLFLRVQLMSHAVMIEGAQTHPVPVTGAATVLVNKSLIVTHMPVMNGLRIMIMTYRS